MSVQINTKKVEKVIAGQTIIEKLRKEIKIENAAKLLTLFIKSTFLENIYLGTSPTIEEDEQQKLYNLMCDYKDKKWIETVQNRTSSSGLFGTSSFSYIVKYSTLFAMAKAKDEVDDYGDLKFKNSSIDKILINPDNFTISDEDRKAIIDNLVNCDYHRINLSPYEESRLTDPNGGHWDLWSVNNDEKCISVNLSEDRECDCYNDKLNKDIKEILLECNQRFDGICIEEDYENHKKWFLDKMIGLSNRIERYFDLFSGNPKDSFPYFVSLEALRYAYQVPREGKVIYIYKTQTKWYLKRYKYTNYQKNDEVVLNLLESKELAIANTRQDETIRKLIIFCQNVTCFLVKDDTQEYSLPFSYKSKIQYIPDEEEEKIKSHFSAMLAEYADSDDNEYEATKLMANMRLKECGLS